MVSLAPGVRSRPHRTKRVASAARSDYQRRDIQGLRALAVVAVILDHLIHWPSAGFVGVDVFFVISGFMITGHLLREHDKTGRISLRSFYRRRVRRLVPASVLVLASTVAAASLLFSFPRFVRTAGDATAALFFAGNWRTATQGTDYFQSSSPPSPIQHFWSLGVEEQFYLVWPPLLVAIILVTRIHAKWDPKRTGIVVGTAIIALIVVSYWWAIVDTAANPSWAYFSTFSRAWELGAGALIAVTANIYSRIPNSARPLLAWAGIAGIVASMFVINPASPFPGPWAVLPVTASALVIIANQGGQQGSLAPLTNPVAVYIGDLSYSLYLWHFPVIVFASAFIDMDSVGSILITAGSILLLAGYSYHLLEDPIRRSTWLEPRPRRDRSTASPSRRRHRRRSEQEPGKRVFNRRYQLIATSFVSLVAIGLVVGAVHSAVPDSSVGGPVVAVPSGAVSTSTGESEDKGALAQLQAQIATARSARTWPKNLSPSMNEAILGKQSPEDIGRCGQIQPISVDDCTWGSVDAERTAVIVGDSVAVTYVNTLRQVMIQDKKWKLRSYAAFGCTFTAVDVKGTDEDLNKGCAAKKKEAVRGIRNLKPDVVFITNTSEPRPGLSTEEMAASTEEIVQTFRSSTKQVVFLSAPPSDVNIQECYSRVSKPGRCISQVTPQWLSVAQADQKMATAVKGLWVDSRPLFCVEGACPSFVGRTPVKSDVVHMTPEYAKRIAPSMAEILRSHRIIR